MLSQPVECLGVVLAGGLSSRMGQDKSELARQSNNVQHTAVNMLDFSKQLLIDSGINQVVISGDKHQVPDVIPQAGPVGGIYSVLTSIPEHNRPKALMIIPVDLPLMTASALADLRTKGELSQKAAFFQDRQQRVHHIPLYLPVNAFLDMYLTQAFKEISSNVANSKKKFGPSVKGMLKQIPHLIVKNAEQKLLFNSNTPQEWQQAQSQLNLINKI